MTEGKKSVLSIATRFSPNGAITFRSRPDTWSQDQLSLLVVRFFSRKWLYKSSFKVCIDAKCFRHTHLFCSVYSFLLRIVCIKIKQKILEDLWLSVDSTDFQKNSIKLDPKSKMHQNESPQIKKIMGQSSFKSDILILDRV